MRKILKLVLTESKLVHAQNLKIVLTGFEALIVIENLLSISAYNPTVRDSLIIDASNRFFTMIPFFYPHVIKDENDFKSKVYMRFTQNFKLFIEAKLILDTSHGLLCCFRM